MAMAGAAYCLRRAGFNCSRIPRLLRGIDCGNIPVHQFLSSSARDWNASPRYESELTASLERFRPTRLPGSVRSDAYESAAQLFRSLLENIDLNKKIGCVLNAGKRPPLCS